MLLKLSDSQECVLTLDPRDAAGQVAPLDGAAEWLSNNSEIVTVTASADGLSATATTTGALGMATISVSADAKIGDGVSAISGSIDIEVGPGQATVINITAGEPTEKA